LVGSGVSEGVLDGVFEGVFEGIGVGGVPLIPTSRMMVLEVVAEIGIGGMFTRGTTGWKFRMTVTLIRSPKSMYSVGGQPLIGANSVPSSWKRV
jgi:hypothetical protein